MPVSFAGASLPVDFTHPPRIARWMLIGCCVGATVLASACTSSHTMRRPAPSSRIALNHRSDVEVIERTPAPTSIPAPPAAAVSQLIEDALRRAGNVSRAELVQRLGLPRRMQTAPVSNQYELGRTDTVRTLTYPGLKAVLYESTQPTRTFLIRLTLTNRYYRSPEGLYIGMSPAQVIDRVGPPTERDSTSNKFIYAESKSMPTALILTIRSDRVTKITWEFYFS